MKKDIKVGSLVKSRFFTAIVVNIVTYEEYRDTDYSWFLHSDEESYWACVNNDLMICLKTLHDKRKYMPRLGAIHWIPEAEMRLHTDTEHVKDRWEVFSSS